MPRGPFDDQRWGLVPQGMFGPVQDGEPIVDGIAGSALVVTGNSGFSDLANWTGSYRLQVTVPGRQPYLVDHTSWIMRDKHPVPGCRLPVTVSRSDPDDLRVDWERAPTIEQMIAAREPAILDPEGTWHRLLPLAKVFLGPAQPDVESARDVLRTHLRADSLLVRNADEMLGAQTDDTERSPWQQVTLEGWPPPHDTGERIAATALVVDASHNPYPYTNGDRLMPSPHFASRGGTVEFSPWHYLGWLLLCVVLPGGARYGAYTRCRIHSRHMGPVLPVAVHRNNPADIEIEWNAGPDASALQAARTDRGTAYMSEVAHEALAFQQSVWDSYAHPPSAQPATTSGDIASALRRLDQLHATGVLTDAELAAERARLLDSI